MVDKHVKAAREAFGDSHALHGEPRMMSIHHGHRHADGTVVSHDEPYCVFKCPGCGELEHIPFDEDGGE